MDTILTLVEIRRALFWLEDQYDGMMSVGLCIRRLKTPSLSGNQVGLSMATSTAGGRADCFLGRQLRSHYQSFLPQHTSAREPEPFLRRRQ